MQIYGTTVNPKRQSPSPIIDVLNYIGNPFKQKHFSTKAYLTHPVNHSEVDLEYALKFLYSFNGSSATYNSYRKEVERLLQWSWRIENASILTLRRESIEAFLQFCLNPPMAWIGTKQAARFKFENGERLSNKEWRPFVTSVSKTDFRKGVLI